jgi:hypothetical protein
VLLAAAVHAAPPPAPPAQQPLPRVATAAGGLHPVGSRMSLAVTAPLPVRRASSFGVAMPPPPAVTTRPVSRTPQLGPAPAPPLPPASPRLSVATPMPPPPLAPLGGAVGMSPYQAPAPESLCGAVSALLAALARASARVVCGTHGPPHAVRAAAHDWAPRYAQCVAAAVAAHVPDTVLHESLAHLEPAAGEDGQPHATLGLLLLSRELLRLRVRLPLPLLHVLPARAAWACVRVLESRSPPPVEVTAARATLDEVCVAIAALPLVAAVEVRLFARKGIFC